MVTRWFVSGGSLDLDLDLDRIRTLVLPLSSSSLPPLGPAMGYARLLTSSFSFSSLKS